MFITPPFTALPHKEKSNTHYTHSTIRRQPAHNSNNAHMLKHHPAVALANPTRTLATQLHTHLSVTTRPRHELNRIHSTAPWL